MKRKLPKTNSAAENSSKRINTWAVTPVRYSGSYLKWTKEEHRQIDQRIRKSMTMNKLLQPRDYIDRMCQQKKKEEDSPALRTAKMYQFKDLRTKF